MKRCSIILLFLLSLFSCQKLNEELDKASSNIDLLEEQTITTINEQITSINQDISALHSVQAAFQSEISSLKKDIAELETAMQTLRNERSRLLGEIEKLEENAASVRDDLSDASSDINNNIDNLKDAINKQLNELRSQVSTVEAQINSLQQQDSKLRAEVELLTNKDEAIQESITTLQSYVDKEIKEFSDAAAATYMTIEHYNSVIEQLSNLKTEIATWHTEIHSALDSAIAEVSNSLDYIEERTAAMEQLVESVVNGVESLIYIPIHEDGRATLYFSNEQGVITNSYAVLDFAVHPASAATELATLWNNVLSVKAMYAIPTMDTSTIPITSVSANDGVLTIVVDGSTLNESVYHEESSVSLRLEVANSTNTITSKYIGLKRYDIGDIITIPDVIFKAYMVDNFDSDGDGGISKSEAATILEIDVSGKDVKSLAGIDYCTNLKSLKCSNTQIQHLKLDELTNLTTLDCSNTPISNLNVPNLANLEMLDCSNTQIQCLNLDELNLANLEVLDCSNTKIQTFDCQGLSKLTTLNISNCKELTSLDCSNCALQYLDVNNNTSLQKLNVADNLLLVLDIHTNTALEELCAEGLAITDIDLSNNNGLTKVLLTNNQNLSSITIWEKCKQRNNYIDFDMGGMVVEDAAGNQFGYPFKVGQYIPWFNGGVVYKTTNNGANGYIVSVTEGTSLRWGPTSTTTSATDKDNGANNMKKIKALSSWQANYPAFAWCYSYGTDWYLPALNELKTIYNNKTTINSALSANGFTALGTGDYWSSTESSSNYAYELFFSNGVSNDPSKNHTNTVTVRAILAF